MESGLLEFFGIFFAFIGIITYFIGRHHSSQENTQLRAQLSSLEGNIREDMIDVTNAGNRTKDGGNVVMRDGKVAADITRKTGDIIETTEKINVVKNSRRQMIENTDVDDRLDVVVKRGNTKESD